MMTGAAVHRQDRPWADAYVTVLCGPFDMPSADTIRGAVRALATQSPHSRLTWSLDRTKWQWRDDRAAESVVVERDWDAQATVGDVLDAMLQDETLTPPFTLVRYPNHLGLKMSHGIGDGRTFLTINSVVMQTAIGAASAQWPARPAGRYPLLSAAFRTFGRHPSMIVSAVKDRDRSPHDTTTSTTQPWTPSRRAIYGAIPRQHADELYSYGKAFAPGSNSFGLQVSLLLRALRRVGLNVADEIRLVVDLRRYLGSTFIDGNFVAGVPMGINWKTPPEQIAAKIRATTLSGRPLVTQMLTSLRLGGPMPVPNSVDPQAQPLVTISSFGRSPELAGLPYLPGRATVYAGSVEPSGPTGLTFLVGENAQALMFAASFHDNVIDHGKVDDAIKLCITDPVGVLAGPLGVP